MSICLFLSFSLSLSLCLFRFLFSYFPIHFHCDLKRSSVLFLNRTKTTITHWSMSYPSLSPYYCIEFLVFVRVCPFLFIHASEFINILCICVCINRLKKIVNFFFCSRCFIEKSMRKLFFCHCVHCVFNSLRYVSISISSFRTHKQTPPSNNKIRIFLFFIN